MIAQQHRENRLTTWVYEQDLWTDRQNMQERLARTDSIRALDRWKWLNYPDELTTPKTLRELFGEFDVVSVGLATDQRERAWRGVRNGLGMGAIGDPIRFQSQPMLFWLKATCFPR